MEITKLSQLDLNKSYTYFDYLKWKFEERVELFNGKILAMSPAPARKHQRISSEISYLLMDFLRKKSCEVYSAPFDVRLERTLDDKKVINVVQPDICVICDLTKTDIRGCSGAPELVIEILSPGNTQKEMGVKFELYEASGVLEYWIVDPEKEIILQYVAENGQFVNHRPLTNEDSLKSKVLAGFEFALKDIFTL